MYISLFLISHKSLKKHCFKKYLLFSYNNSFALSKVIYLPIENKNKKSYKRKKIINKQNFIFKL